MKILITGGAGYIGATIASACLDAGHTPVILDDLSTGRRAHVTGRIFYCGSIADSDLIRRIVADHSDIEAVIHCAARIIVPESIDDPLGYYDANVADSIRLLRALHYAGLTRIVFSSTAALYAGNDGGGIAEDAPLRPLSPYARSKGMVERVLEDAAGAGELRAISLRYFNPIGVDPSFRSGPTCDRPTHVLGMLQRAAEEGAPFTVTGVDWPTRDGSGLRDFIHVWDLALAHVRAVERFDSVVTSDAPYRVLNLGTGAGTTVRELAAMFIDESHAPLRVVDGPRRAGDTAGAYAAVDRAQSLLASNAERTVRDGIRSALEWRRRVNSPAD